MTLLLIFLKLKTKNCFNRRKKLSRIRTKFEIFPRGGESTENEEVSPRKRGGQGVIAMNTEAVCGSISVDPESEINDHLKQVKLFVVQFKILENKQRI